MKKEELYCPNKSCEHHNNPPDTHSWFRKKGFARTKREGKVQRYQCKSCGTTFSLNYFSINHYVHKKISTPRLLNHLVSCSGIRDMGRALHCSPKIITHRIKRLSERILSICPREVDALDLSESVAVDGLENFILSQFFPTNVNVLVGSDSQFLYTFNSYHFKRKGRCTEEQKKIKEILYKEAQFEEGAASKRFLDILDFLSAKAEKSSLTSLILDTDECPIYRTQFNKHESIGDKVIHRKTNSHKERNYQNKLFPCNYMDRQIRKDLAEFMRETVQFGRNMNNSMDRFTCYSFWHNFLKPFRINKKEGAYDFHAQAAGFSKEQIHEIVWNVFDGVRVREETFMEYLTDFQRSHWERALVSPLKKKAV